MLRNRVLTHEGGGAKLEGEGKVGDVVLYDSNSKKLIPVSNSKLNSTNYPISRYTPIGVVVIPTSHDVYGTGQCGVMSSRLMSTDSPDNGTVSKSKVYWGGGGRNIPELPNLGGVPLISSALTSNDIIGFNYYGYLPSLFNYNFSPSAGKGLDTYYGYYPYYEEKLYIPSPYLENGSRNPSYYSTDTSIHPGLSGNCLSDFNGKENTEIILTYATGQTDWKTASAITNSYYRGYYPAACCCWRYHTSGTSQGDWYLPSAGEFGYLVVRSTEITLAQSSIVSYSQEHEWDFSLTYKYYTSLQRDSEYSLGIDLYRGNVREKYSYYDNSYVIAFIRL